MTTTCHFCKTEAQRNINAAHWTGTEYVRVNVCSNCRDQIADAPRRPRQARQQPILDRAGWSVVPGLNKMLAGK